MYFFAIVRKKCFTGKSQKDADDLDIFIKEYEVFLRAYLRLQSKAVRVIAYFKKILQNDERLDGAS